jgi:hypothetical protein
MNVAIRRFVIGTSLVVSGLAVTVRPVSAQVTDQQVVDQAAVANAQATVNFDLPVTTPNISWVAPRNTPKARFSDASMAPRQSSSGGVGIGALIGYVNTSATGDTNDTDFKFDSGSGWMAGIWFGGNRNGVLGVMGELSYVLKKVQPVGDDPNEPAVELGYLEIPVLLRINIGQASANGFRVYGVVGPAFDFKISDNRDDFGFDDNAFESFDIGILAGGGFEVARLAFEVRGNWGLRNIVAQDITDNRSLKAFSLQILGKIRFN